MPGWVVGRPTARARAKRAAVRTLGTVPVCAASPASSASAWTETDDLAVDRQLPEEFLRLDALQVAVFAASTCAVRPHLNPDQTGLAGPWRRRAGVLGRSEAARLMDDSSRWRLALEGEP